MTNFRTDSVVNVLLAEVSYEHLEILKFFGEDQPEIHICGAVTDGSAVLELLGNGVQADVLVMDTMLQGLSVLEVLREIGAMHLVHRPYILLTSCSCSAQMQSTYIQAGADIIRLKPYTLSGLYDDVCALQGCRRYLNRRVDELLRIHLERMQLMPDDTNYWYMFETGRRMVMIKGPVCVGKDVYSEVAQQCGVSRPAVESGVRRAIERMQSRNSAEYNAIRIHLQIQEGKSISNNDFLGRLAQIVQMEM